MLSPFRLLSACTFALAVSRTVRAITPGFAYGSEKVRGVNLGGWLVLCVFFFQHFMPCPRADRVALVSVRYFNRALSILSAPADWKGGPTSSHGLPHPSSKRLATPPSSTSGRSVNIRTTVPLKQLSRTTGIPGSLSRTSSTSPPQGTLHFRSSPHVANSRLVTRATF